LGEAGSNFQRSATALERALEKDWQTVSGFLREHPEFLREDEALLGDLGLRPRADNIVEFGPAALARLSEERTRESVARQQVELTARANFVAQAQAQAAVIDLLEADSHTNLAGRLTEICELRFGLVAGVIAVEGPAPAPNGWRGVLPGMVDKVLGKGVLARMGETTYSTLLFGEDAPAVKSVALVRIALWNPARQGIVAFGSPEEDGFTEDMGVELVAFLARVIERTAERWPAR